MSSEVFGVTHKLNKFRPRLRGRSLNLFFEFVALSNRQIFGASRINSKRYVKYCLLYLIFLFLCCFLITIFCFSRCKDTNIFQFHQKFAPFGIQYRKTITSIHSLLTICYEAQKTFFNRLFLYRISTVRIRQKPMLISLFYLYQDSS